MEEKVNLRIPGPTPCPPDILEAASKPMINHRGPEFKQLLYSVTERLKQVFETSGDVFILSASGTGGLEAAIVNTLSPGDKVLSVSIGYFGNRFREIAQAYGAQVVPLDYDWGSAADPDQVRQALKDDPEIKAVMITHNETSTGVTNDLETIAGIVKGEFDRLLLVDAVSSLAAIPLPVDGWRCDVVATASQKGWMVPPGLAFVSFSQRAWQALSEARMPRYFFDMAKAKSYYDRGQTPWTPTLSSMFATDLALDRLLSEGMPSVFQRHARIGQMTRDGVKALGLSLLPDEAIASNAVTAVNNPEGVDGARLLETLRVENNIVIAGGQGPLTGKIFRIGHMGYCEPQDIQDLLEALKLVLPTMGFKPAGVGARGD